MGTLLPNLKYGLRAPAQDPSFTRAHVIPRSLRIGADRAVFNRNLLEPFSTINSRRLVVVSESTPQCGMTPHRDPRLPDRRERNRNLKRDFFEKHAN